MEISKLSLKTKIMLFTSFIIIASVVFISIFFSIWTVNNLKEKIRVNNMNTALSISNYPYFGDILGQGDPSGFIQNYTYEQLKALKDIDMIVVANMEGRRFAHPKADRLGRCFVGGDEEKVTKTGASYISEAVGTLGPSLRAFAPICNSKGKQVGFIMVGTLVEEIIALQKDALKTIILYSTGGLILGLIGAIFFSSNIKKTLLGLEPHQISRLYIEKNGMLQAIQEGIISIDQHKRITMINDSAKSILGIEGKNPIGEKIFDMFPNSGLEEVLETGIPLKEKEKDLYGINIVMNIVPIINKGETIGVIASFRDKTELTRLAEEITGFNEVVQTLRANSHEFLNKLHVILGLVRIGDIEEIKRYILNIKDTREQLLVSVMKKINDPVLAGIVLGKISRAKELGINFHINSTSPIQAIDDKDKATALVIIIGNLIENAFEATVKENKDNKRVSLSIDELEDKIEITINDNGLGIEKEYIEKIFERGYSTKSENRGIGLALVKEKVEKLYGVIKVSSSIGEGTTFKVIIPKEERRNVQSANS
ncbi:GHKL domain-containing protein [Schnuerera sp. xch1]|uniref:ATP-binding protein n=1 Tax=Schnuerera sp. xch1 TaxID=2874283 RepID=UPI001CC16D9B|nr:ATP-binding protein [Schnuerera sp. xch1]MBZ2174036.1 GHKL domain-containing protein [Schnuerera sp. xch1]